MMYGKNPGSELVANLIPADSVGVEIGVWRGESSLRFLKRAAHLHMVDPWSVSAYGNDPAYLDRYTKLVGSSRPESFQAYYDNVYREVCERFAGKSVTIHRMTSAEFFSGFATSVDWAYIDGDHSYYACLSDLEGAHFCVRNGGQIFCDDYGTGNPRLEGVTRAVDDFAKANELTVIPLGLFQCQIQL